MIAGAILAVAGIGAVYRVVALPIPEMLEPAQSSKLLAYDGQVIATLHGEENRTLVPLDQISPFLQLAVQFTEDRDFYSHRGVSLKAVIRAARANMEGGSIVQGGSTITQQLVRNAFTEVTRERTYKRKLKEAYWAMRLEGVMSKDQILERYLNTVYFGRGAYGAEAAARTYFKIPATELTPGQAAYLAGLIRAPERYQLDRNPEGAVALRNQVLDGMARSGYLGPGEAEAATAEDLLAQYRPGQSIELDSPRAGYFVEYVRRLLKRDFGLDDEQILAGGLRIETTLDLAMQDAAEHAVRSTLDRPDDPEAALIALDPQGRIRAMVGGRDVDSIDRSRGFNFAADVNGTGGGRQAGSAFKPIALSAFLSEGMSLGSTFSGASPIDIDSPRCRNGDGTAWEVSNFGNASYGSMDVTAATLSSVNTIYAQIMDRVVSPTLFMTTAEQLGISIPRYDAGCALTLGTTDVTPLEMGAAYTTFAQRGQHPKPLAITRITGPDGEVIAERSPVVTPRLDANVADTVNYVLERNIRAGTGTGARLDRPAAGKTGTSQDFQNAWFAGYTPDLTAVVWMGYAPLPDGTIPVMDRVRGRRVTGGSFPATIWREFMERALAGVEKSDFHRPHLGGELVHGSLPEPEATLATTDQATEIEPSPPPRDEPAQALLPGMAPRPPDAPEPAPEPPRSNIGRPCFPFCD